MGNGGKGASLSPKSMVDSVADWDLHQVVEHLKKRSKEESQPAEYSRIWCRSSIRFLNTVITAAAESFGLSRGRMCRYLTYHGASILQNDSVIQGLVKKYHELNKLAIERDNPDIADIVDNVISYSPRDVDARRIDFYAYDLRTVSQFEEDAQACGVYPGQIAQMAMIRSLLTYDLPDLAPVMERLGKEQQRWALWMNFRLGMLEITVAKWESLL